MKRILFVLVASFALALSACGGQKPTTTIDVVLTDFAFQPKEFVIPAGAEITVNAVNNGAVEHEFVIMKFGTTVGTDFGDEDEENIYWEIEVFPGQKGSGTFTAPSDLGDYQLVCGTPGHFIAGMIGKIIVVAADE
jgi:uncharacterized cupredoxin-like copper-binding protein